MADSSIRDAVLHEGSASACSIPGCAGKHKALGLCLRHYRQHQAGGVKQDATACVHCAQPFTPVTVASHYCSSRCKLAAWRAKNPEQAASHRAKSANAARQNAEALRPQRQQAKREAAAERRRQAALLAQQRQADAIAEKSASLGSRPCVVCSAPVGYRLGGGARMYCSPACNRLSPPSQAVRRAARLRRRALERGDGAESFDPLAVLERDGWHCKACGIETPRALRGSIAPNAPEVDHIHPLSKGGLHRFDNVQCLCRACNQAKGADLTTRGALAAEAA